MPALLYEVSTADKPVKLKAGIAATFRVYELSFSQLAEIVRRASMTLEYAKTQRAIRRQLQVKAYDAGGTEIPIGDGELLQLPRPLYARITENIDMNSGAPAGKIIADGDGLDHPLIFQLGTGINIGGDKAQVITDLEFQAKTGADIEDVLCETTGAGQALTLIMTCATPLTKDLGLLRLPSWAVEQITEADGMEIVTKVLPRFLS